MGKTLDKLVLTLSLAAGILAGAPTPTKADPIPYRTHFQKYIRSEASRTIEGEKIKAVSLTGHKEVKGVNGGATKLKAVKELLLMNDSKNHTTTCEANIREYPKTSKTPLSKTVVFGRGYNGSNSPTAVKNTVKTWDLDCYKDINHDSRPDLEYHGVVFDHDTPVRRLQRDHNPLSMIKWRPVKSYSFDGKSRDRAKARKTYFKTNGYKKVNKNPGQHHYLIPYQLISISTKNHKKI